jgi:hypothetical protein
LRRLEDGAADNENLSFVDISKISEIYGRMEDGRTPKEEGDAAIERIRER